MVHLLNIDEDPSVRVPGVRRCLYIIHFVLYDQELIPVIVILDMDTTLILAAQVLAAADTIMT